MVDVDSARSSPVEQAISRPSSRLGNLKRKPVPQITVVDHRYPAFDPEDPFAPLTALRRRSYSLATSQLYPEKSHSPQPSLQLQRSSLVNLCSPDSPSNLSKYGSGAFSGADVILHNRPPATHGPHYLLHHHHHQNHCERTQDVTSLDDAEPSPPSYYPSVLQRSPHRLSTTSSSSSPPTIFASEFGREGSISASHSSDEMTLNGQQYDFSPPELPFAPRHGKCGTSLTMKHRPSYKGSLFEGTHPDGEDIRSMSPIPRCMSATPTDRRVFFVVPDLPSSSQSSHEKESWSQSQSQDSTTGVHVTSVPYVDAGLLLHRPPSRSRVFSFHSRNPSKLKVENSGNLEAPAFDQHIKPNFQQLALAQSMSVIAESGVRVRFGDLWRDKKTIIIFIRHFWCVSCQDYMASIISQTSPSALERMGTNLVIIGSGSHSLIKQYNGLTRNKFTLYTDPSLELYRALGMTKQSTDPGPDSEKGDYIRRGALSGVSKMLFKAMKGRMSLFDNAGNNAQLGGEFVLGPGLTCSFAHRMKNTRSHSPISLVIQAAGLTRRVSFPVDERSLTADVDEEEWMERRRLSLIRMRAKRDLRRAYPIDEADMVEDEVVFKPGLLGTLEPTLPLERRIVIEDGEDGDDEASE